MLCKKSIHWRSVQRDGVAIAHLALARVDLFLGPLRTLPASVPQLAVAIVALQIVADVRRAIIIQDERNIVAGIAVLVYDGRLPSDSRPVRVSHAIGEIAQIVGQVQMVV